MWCTGRGLGLGNPELCWFEGCGVCEGVVVGFGSVCAWVVSCGRMNDEFGVGRGGRFWCVLLLIGKGQ